MLADSIAVEFGLGRILRETVNRNGFSRNEVKSTTLADSIAVEFRFGRLLCDTANRDGFSQNGSWKYNV